MNATLETENVKPPQQWELLASPGHMLLAQVDAYRLLTKPLKKHGTGALLLVIGAFMFAPWAGQKTGNGAAWITSKVASWTKPKDYPKSPAPVVRQLVPVLPRGSFDVAAIPDLTNDVARVMVDQVEAMKTGKRVGPTDCDATKQITDVWLKGIEPDGTGTDAFPKCRYSKDFTRLYVWTYAKKNQYQHGPFIGVIMKRDGDAKYYNIKAPGALPIPGMPDLDLNLIPRTVAADFPELTVGGK